MSAVVLTGFQLMQLLAVVDHKADQKVVIDQPQGPFAGITHARLFDQNSSEVQFIPESGVKFCEIAEQKCAQAAARRRAQCAVRQCDAAACETGCACPGDCVAQGSS